MVLVILYAGHISCSWDKFMIRFSLLLLTIFHMCFLILSNFLFTTCERKWDISPSLSLGRRRKRSAFVII
jgi:preprotein translocase subunit SecG